MIRAVSLIIFISVSSVFTTGCSPKAIVEIFTGGGDEPDSKVTDTPSTYRQGASSSCGEIRLSEGRLSEPMFRTLVDCLNSNGSYADLAQWMGRTTSAELEPLVDLLNRFLFSKEGQLSDFTRAFEVLYRMGWTDSFMKQVGSVLKKDAWVEGLGSSMIELDRRKQLPRFSRFLGQLGDRLTVESAEQGLMPLDEGIRSSAFRSMTKKLKATEGLIPFNQWVGALYAGGTGGFADAVSRLVSMIQQDRWQPAVTAVMQDETTERFQKRTGDLRALMRWLTHQQHQGVSHFGRVGLLVRGLSEPAPCFRGTHQVRRIIQKIFNEMISFENSDQARRFVQKDVILDCLLVSALCEVPREVIAANYPTIQSLGQLSGMDTLYEVLKGLANVDAELLLDFERLLLESDRIEPLLYNLSQADVWPEVLDLISGMTRTYGDRLKGWTSFLASEQTLGPTRLDDFVGLARAMGPEALSHLTMGLFQLITSVSESAESNLFGMFRVGLRTGSFDFALTELRGFLTSEEETKRFFGAIASLARAGRLSEGAQIFSSLANDGRLFGFVEQMVELLGGRLDRNSGVGVTMPALSRAGRTDRFRQVENTRLTSVRFAGLEACSKMNLSLNLYEVAGSPKDFYYFVRCLGEGTPAWDDLNYLVREKYDADRTWLQYSLSHIHDFFEMHSDQELHALGERWIRTIQSGSYQQFLSQFPNWIPMGASGMNHPMIQSARQLSNQGAFTDQWFRSFGTLLKDPWTYEILNEVSQSPGGSSEKDLESVRSEGSEVVFDETIFSQQVRQYSCTVDPEEISLSIEGALTKAKRPQSLWINRRVHGWNFQVNRGDQVERLLARIKKVDWLEQAIEKFARKPKFWTWLRELSTDFKPTPFLFSGQTRPSVVIASSLDRLELLFLESNWNLPGMDYFSARYMRMIAESWGDLPRNQWPLEIQQKYRHPLQPPSLVEVMTAIEKDLKFFQETLGDPPLDECVQLDREIYRDALLGFGSRMIQERLFNMDLLLDSARELLFSENAPIVRAVLFEILKSSPELLAKPLVLQQEVSVSKATSLLWAVAAGDLEELFSVNQNIDGYMRESWQKSFDQPNPFSILAQLGSLGVLHEISHTVREYPEMISQVERVLRVGSSEASSRMVDVFVRALNRDAMKWIEDGFRQSLKDEPLVGFAQVLEVMDDETIGHFLRGWARSSRFAAGSEVEPFLRIARSRLFAHLATRFTESDLEWNRRTQAWLQDGFKDPDFSWVWFSWMVSMSQLDPSSSESFDPQFSKELQVFVEFLSKESPGSDLVREYFALWLEKEGSQLTAYMVDHPEQFYPMMSAFVAWLASDEFSSFMGRAIRFIDES